MQRSKVIGVLFLLVLAFRLSAQEIEVRKMDELLLGDSSEAKTQIDLDAFMAMVLTYHPVVKQADLLPETARQELRLARGAFDPKLESSWDVKHFKDTDYYDIFNTTLKIPTWFPLDPKLSIDRNKGDFLNPENRIPESDAYRQVTAGLSLPVGRGLMIDQRRAAVKQAQIFQQINEAERIKMINKVLLSATKAYWDWYFAYYNFLLIDESLNISQEIYRRVRLDFNFGEAAVVDTVQAAITLQNRKVDRRQGLIDFKAAGLELSNFLWGENQLPLEMSENLIPQLLTFVDPVPGAQVLDSLAQLAVIRHPDLIKTDRKLDQLVIDEKLAKENLKPRVDLNYNIINAPLDARGDFVDVQLRENYKLGFSFEFPLFLRKERAKLKQTRIKIDQTTYKRELQQREILNGIAANFFSLTNTNSMLGDMQQAVDNYTRLLEAELFNLQIGESDLFKINFQQDKLLEAQIKLMKMRANLEKARVSLFWAAGVPYLNFQPANLD